VISTGGGSILIPRAAEKYGKRGKKSFIDFMKFVAFFWVIAFLGYSLLIAVAPNFWLHFFYGKKYEGTGGILIIWAVIYSVMGLNLLPNTIVYILRRPDLIMYIKLIAGILVLITSSFLSAKNGASGAAIARLSGEVTILVLTVPLSYQLLIKDKEKGIINR